MLPQVAVIRTGGETPGRLINNFLRSPTRSSRHLPIHRDCSSELCLSIESSYMSVNVLQAQRDTSTFCFERADARGGWITDSANSGRALGRSHTAEHLAAWGNLKESFSERYADEQCTYLPQHSEERCLCRCVEPSLVDSSTQHIRSLITRGTVCKTAHLPSIATPFL